MVTSPFVSNSEHSLHLNTHMPNGDFVIISYFNYLKYTGHPTIFLFQITTIQAYQLDII